MEGDHIKALQAFESRIKQAIEQGNIAAARVIVDSEAGLYHAVGYYNAAEVYYQLSIAQQSKDVAFDYLKQSMIFYKAAIMLQPYSEQSLLNASCYELELSEVDNVAKRISARLSELNIPLAKQDAEAIDNAVEEIIEEAIQPATI